ncbi:MAG: YjgP/YjgQ family permease [Alphaproteobacteria bacterium]|nr:YjgP/YjgQ family permease [Alphaproteobacteria bacterium]MBE8220995.1 YjgP/YjgQ family permease [Alphaproteobacteria bacterium]
MTLQLNRYIFKQFATRYVTVALALTLIVWVVQAVNLTDNLVGSSDSVVEFMGLISFTLPRVLTFIIAPAMLISVVMQLVSMQQSHEYFALAANGISPTQILKPLLVLVLLMTIIQALIAFYGAPQALKNLRLRSVHAASGALSTGFPANSFADITPTLTIFVGESVGTNSWRRIMIQDRSNGAHITYFARKGTVSERDNTSYFLLENGTVHSTQEGQEADIVSFGEYVLPFTLPTPELRLNRNHLMIHELFNPSAYGITNPNSIARMQTRGWLLLSNLANPLIFVLISFLVVTGKELSRHGATRYILITALFGIVFQLVNSTLNNANTPYFSMLWTFLWVAVLTAFVFARNRIRTPTLTPALKEGAL